MLVAGTITMMEITMSISARPRINSDSFVAWAMEQPITRDPPGIVLENIFV